MIEFMKEPWPWYVAGTIIGLTVPILLILGNKTFGISANLRHICAACIPGNVKFFRYDWKKEKWNLLFVAGIIIGSAIAATVLADSKDVVVHPDLVKELAGYNIKNLSSLIPSDIFSFSSLFTLRGSVLMIGGGFLVGFGTRYAGGCTSGHSIMGLSTLQWPSLVATISFMVGGFIMANLIMPVIMSL
jgi:uncharacterized protein